MWIAAAVVALVGACGGDDERSANGTSSASSLPAIDGAAEQSRDELDATDVCPADSEVSTAVGVDVEHDPNQAFEGYCPYFYARRADVPLDDLSAGITVELKRDSSAVEEARMLYVDGICGPDDLRFREDLGADAFETGCRTSIAGVGGAPADPFQYAVLGFPTATGSAVVTINMGSDYAPGDDPTGSVARQAVDALASSAAIRSWLQG